MNEKNSHINKNFLRLCYAKPTGTEYGMSVGQRDQKVVKLKHIGKTEKKETKEL